MMSTTQTWILRSSIVLCMVVAVVTILYFTPMPEHYFKSCDRPCHELDWPMICRVKITLEQYETLNSYCESCPNNMTQCDNRHCVPADGYKRALFTANRELPGPSIQVCQNDILLVDVMNKVPGQEFSIHWRGQNQHGTACMDGVPMVTQCPISSFTTFQYKFRASAPGTHTWHAHSSSQRADGIFGALVVRQADLMEPQRRLYDTDDKRHVMMITEWNGGSPLSQPDSPTTILINGRTTAKISVKHNQRHRFRVAYASGSTGCPIRLSVERHPLKIIALDGFPTAPLEATSITFGRGERIDFVLKGNRPSGAYKMKVESTCDGIAPAEAWIVYENDKMDKKKSVKFSDEEMAGERNFRTDLCDSALGQVCLGDVQSLFVMPASLRTEKVDTKLHLAIEHLSIEQYGLDKMTSKIPRINNVTFTYPSSPLLTQYDDVSYSTICNQDNMPEQCKNRTVCECVHVEDIPLDNSVELILLNMEDEEEHSFHLHGYSFYIVGHREFANRVTLDEVKRLDEKKELFKRNLKSPARKDTIRVPKNGVVAIRFVASNPGYWMLRDEHANHWTRGLDIILHVGSRRDLSAPPSDFPKCGNWVGPDFFLA